MTLNCPCGEVLYEGGHPQPDKAIFFTSLELTDFLESLEPQRLIDVREILRVIGGDILQCNVCGRVFIQDRERYTYHRFVPESGGVSKTLFDRRPADA